MEVQEESKKSSKAVTDANVFSYIISYKLVD